MLIIKYKLNRKQHKVRVSYRHSANIIAGLLQAGAKLVSVGSKLTPKG